MVSVSHSAAEYFSKKYKIRTPTVITNCPYSEFVLPDPVQKEHFEVLYHGQLYLGRGYEEFVKSALFLKKNVLLLIRGYGFLENELRQIVIDNQLEKKVRFDPPVEVKDLVSMAATSNVGVVLTQPVNINFKLTVSNKIFEYIHAALPVILSDVPEHRYLNNKYHFGIVVTDFSPQGIADCINRLASDSNEYNRLKRNATIAAKELCWENESKKLLTLYKNLSSKN